MADANPAPRNLDPRPDPLDSPDLPEDDEPDTVATPEGDAEDAPDAVLRPAPKGLQRSPGRHIHNL